MYKKTITYSDYDGVERTEDFFFNLSKAEVLELELSWDGGLEKVLRKIVAAQDQKRIIEMFKMIILKSYGEKSLDGKRFMKEDENGHKLANDFAQTEAYSELFMELATNEQSASEFVNGIIPKNIGDSISKNGAKVEVLPDKGDKVIEMPKAQTAEPAPAK